MVIGVISLTALAETQNCAAGSDFTSGYLPVLPAATTASSVNVGAIRIDIPSGTPSTSANALPTVFEASGTPRTAMAGVATNSGDPASTDESSVGIHGSLSGSLKEREDAPWRHWFR